MGIQYGVNGEEEQRPEFDDMIVDTTRISYVDGAQGQLYYRGINIAELVAHASFEETAWLLLCGKLPSQNQLEAFKWGLSAMNKTQEKVSRIIEELFAGRILVKV